MPTGSGLWHFLYRLVHEFIRSVVSSEKTDGNYFRRLLLFVDCI